MPAFATLPLDNAAATPVDFAPANINSQTGVVSWYSAGASFDARSVVTFSMTFPKVNTTRVKVKGKVSIPVMDGIVAYKKADEILCNFEFSMPKNSLLSDRQDLQAYVSSFLSNPILTSAIEDFESVY